jgi:hypothetical protein
VKDLEILRQALVRYTVAYDRIKGKRQGRIGKDRKNAKDRI